MKSSSKSTTPVVKFPLTQLYLRGEHLLAHVVVESGPYPRIMAFCCTEEDAKTHSFRSGDYAIPWTVKGDGVIRFSRPRRKRATKSKSKA